MKASFAMLAVAAGLGEVNAHWSQNANKYSTPGNTDNYCDSSMKKGWTWDGLSTGSFDSYQGWDFSGGWSCQSSSKRSLDGRTYGKAISGSCGSDVSSAPSFSCGSSSDVNKFSISTFQISVEFDCRMEFHYEMEDGSSCKESHDCSGGSYNTITNTQCGGAKKVSFVYPKQDKPKESCEIEIPSIDFDCSTPDVTTTAPYGEQPTTTPGEGYTVPTGEQPTTTPGEGYTVPTGEETTSIPVGEETTTAPAEETTTAPNSGEETTSVPVGEETTTTPAEETTTAPNSGEETTSVPAEETTSAPAEETTTAPNSGEETTSVPAEETTTAPAEETTTAPNSGEETTSAPAEETTPVTYVTTWDQTSTVYTTQVHTITSCAASVTNCPAKSHTVVVVTETVAVSTTVCPVTETVTGPASTKPVETKPAETTTAPNSGEETTSVPTGEETTTAPSSGEETTSAPSSGEETTSAPSSGEETTSAPGSGEETTTAPSSGEETTIVTSYEKTSTIYTTNVKTITSCAPTVTNCPAKSGTVVVVTETVAVSTTVCPVTETNVVKPTKPGKASATSKSQSPSETTGESSGSTPTSGYDVPDVVPSCLNTFLDYVEDCKDNTDYACYCPKEDFVNKVYQCLYAHGKSDDIIAKAVSFFQGICADYLKKNPAVGTGAGDITSIITVTGTTIIASAHYTTVTIATTITEPCVTGGSTVSGSSTVYTISTEYTVPEVGFTTGPSGKIGVIPPATGTAGASAPYQTATLVTSAPAGTGGYAVPTTTSPAEVPVTGGATRAGMGFAAAILAAALAL